LWLPALIFLAIFFFYPFGRIFWYSLDLTAIRLADLRNAGSVLGFTFWQALLSTILTLALGLPAAWLFARYEFPGKPLLRTLTAIPFMLPTVVVAAGFNAWLGPRGWFNLVLLRLFDYSSDHPAKFTGTLAAILVAHVFYNMTIVIRVAGNALEQLDPRFEQAARTLGADPRRVLWRVTLPLLRPSLLAAALLVFLFDFTSFGVVLLLGGSRFATLEVEIFLQAVQYFNLPLAALLSLIQLLCTLALSVLHSRVAAWTMVATTPRPADSNLRRARSWREKLFVAMSCLLLAAFFALPLLSLPIRSFARLEADQGERGQVSYGLTADYYRELFVNQRGSIFYVPPLRALGNSLVYAAITVVLSLLLGFPVAAALARPARLERVLDPFLMLPLGASAVTLGLGFILSFGRLLASPWMVPLAHTLIALPFVIRAMQPALASIPQRLREAAASLGADPLQAWFAVDWPIVRRAMLSAAVFAFTVSLGEFGAAALLARPEMPTLPVAIYRFLSQPGGMNYGQAMAMATILMTVTGAGILAIEKLRLPGGGEF
jgi:thiamine transport system permease protein